MNTEQGTTDEKMQASKHTPGPWEVGGEWPEIFAVYHECVYIAHAETGIGKDWVDGRNPIGRETAKANARLIAAAPDLLAVVEQIETLYKEVFEHAIAKGASAHATDWGTVNQILCDARAAISKAKGATQ